jgi:cytochrome c oxidase subunit III
MPAVVEEVKETYHGPVLGDSGNDGAPQPPSLDLHLPSVQDPRPPAGSTVIWVGIAAITMMFAALTSALVVRQGASTDWQRIALPNILFLDTLILLASSVTLEISRRRFASVVPSVNESKRFELWLNVTVFLGALFVVGQYVAWLKLRAEGVYLASNPSSSFFYVLTAAHALHVMGGLLGLIYVIAKTRKGIFRKSTLAMASTYWHFMDLLWIYLLALLLMNV